MKTDQIAATFNGICRSFFNGVRQKAVFRKGRIVGQFTKAQLTAFDGIGQGPVNMERLAW